MNDGRGSIVKRARTFLLSAIALTMAFLGTACSYKAGYNVTYLPKPPETARHEGKVLIYMTQEEEDRIYTGSPTSLTGGATTLSLPLGNITKQIAEHIFSQHFSQVQTSNTMTNAAMYVVTIQPTVREFEYAYNSLQNLGFAITPEVEISLHVQVFDAKGEQLFEKAYTSGEVEGETYFASGSPGEQVNEALHKCLCDLMTRAAADVKAAL